MKKALLVLLVTSFLIFPNMAHSTRFMWCWNNDSITNNTGTARTDLFNFCAAPFGDTTKAVNVLYYYAEGLIPGSNAKLRTFLKQAHAQGLKILYLDGDSNWIVNGAGVQTGESFTTTLLAFNAGTSDATQRFDGITYDVEPNSASNWATNEVAYWANFTTMLGYCQAQVSTYNLTHSPHIYFESVISRNWDIDGDPVTDFTQIENICDSVAVLNFVNHFSNITTDPITEITYANTIGKKIVVGFDTGNDSPASSTFYGLGNSVMESDLAIAEPVFSAYSAYQGIAIEFYDPYRNLGCACIPVASFWGTPTSGNSPLTVSFTDGSGNTPTAWNWTFGDGSTSTLQNPTHTYASITGSTTFTVRLIVSNTNGTSTSILTNYIQESGATTKPYPGFSASPTSGVGPLIVNFTDTSANIPTSWNWSFGDGNTDTTQNPSHNYGSVAINTSYNVKLVVSNAFGSSSVTYANYISVSTTLAASGGNVIWDWDSTATIPATAKNSGYIYAYNYTGANGHGIGGSGSLIINAPYQTGISPHRKNGGAVILSNIPGWTFATTNVINNNINLSGLGGSSIYFSVIASETSTFGVAFAAFDTSGGYFINPGSYYLADSTNPHIGSISTSAFQQITWNLANFHVYSPGHKTGRAPALANINAFEFFFAKPVSAPSGSPTLKFYIDNVGAVGYKPTSSGTTGISYGDWSIFSDSLIPPSKDNSILIKE